MYISNISNLQVQYRPLFWPHRGPLEILGGLYCALCASRFHIGSAKKYSFFVTRTLSRGLQGEGSRQIPGRMRKLERL